MARVAARLGLGCPCARCQRDRLALMPHQQLISDVAGEVLPDGRMAYPIVVVLMPRRGGKTGLTLPTSVHRAAWIPRGRVWYTAQTGKDAADTFRDDWLPLVETAPKLIQSRLSNGSMGLSLPRSKGKVGLFAPGPRALHGKEADMATVDEAWAFDDVRGRELETGIRPAQLTRRRRQLWVISAGGTIDSTWLLRWRELGRALTGPDQGLAYFEWHPQAELDDQGRWTVTADLDDPATWADTHPAVGHTIDLADLREDHKTFGAAEFQRSYLNIFQTTRADRVLPQVACERAMDEALTITPGPMAVLSYDVSPDQEWATVSVAERRGDRVALAVLRHDQGSAWVADYVAALRRATGARVLADSVGPATPVTRDLAELGVDVATMSTADVGTAAAELLRDLLRQTVTVRASQVWERAAASVGKRSLGDGGWAFTRKGDEVVSPITSSAQAAWGARHLVHQAPGIFTLADLAEPA